MLAVGAAGDTADPCSQGGATWGRKSLRKGKKTEQEKSEGKKKMCEKPPTDKRKRRSKAENSQRSLLALGGDHGGASIYTAVHRGPHPGEVGYS